jgi:hypothetical protein
MSAYARNTALINKLFHYYSTVYIENTPAEDQVLYLVLNMYDVLLTHRSEYCNPQDDTYGNQNENGTWGGVVGMIVREEADVGINILAFSTERISCIAYLPPIWNSKYTYSS